MPKSKPLKDSQGEVRELTETDMKTFRPAKEALPPAKLGVRGSQKTPTKERICIRLSPDIVRRFRATGHGCQT